MGNPSKRGQGNSNYRQPSSGPDKRGQVHPYDMNGAPSSDASSLNGQAGSYYLDSTNHDASGLGDYLDDAAAAVGGVPVGGLYRNGSVVMVRVS